MSESRGPLPQASWFLKRRTDRMRHWQFLPLQFLAHDQSDALGLGAAVGGQGVRLDVG